MSIIMTKKKLLKKAEDIDESNSDTEKIEVFEKPKTRKPKKFK